jgi:hypothetical protein
MIPCKFKLFQDPNNKEQKRQQLWMKTSTKREN